MSDELLDIFKEEVGEGIANLNNGLLQLEMSKGADRYATLKEMRRVAHSIKGASRSVGNTLIETISHALEQIFDQALKQELTLTPGMGDSLYDGIDLIEHVIEKNTVDQAITDEIIANLHAIVRGERSVTDSDLLQTDSTEIHAVTDELTAVTDANKTQTTPAHGIRDTISDELLSIFWEEVDDHLSTLNNGLLKVEMTHGEEREQLLREMNRVAHSMKGAGRAVGYNTVEIISHHIEDILDLALHHNLEITPHVADMLYDGLDLIKEAVSGNPLSDEIIEAVLMQMLRIIQAADKQMPDFILPDTLQEMQAVLPDDDLAEMPSARALMTSTIESPGASTMLLRPAEDSIRVSVNKLDQMMADTSELLTARLQGDNRHRMLSQLRHDVIRWQREWRSARASYIRLARRLQEQPDVMSAELNALFHFLEFNEDYLTRTTRELTRLDQVLSQDNMHLATLADQLQSNVSSLRMMPFETIVGGFQRLARDVARDIGKQLHLEIQGVAVEIDKTVLDALKDPLMHLLRNAIDHGLEDPATRRQHGKSAVGRVTLSVKQRGSEITISVQDDGRGFDVSRIRRKALERNLITTQESKALTDDDIRMLVFHSGLTTSERVTALSGRGLGMDIVRTRVESLRGRVSIDSVPNQGTTITLYVPVSLTRLSVVTLRLGTEYYAVPSAMVERMETITPDDIFTAEGYEMITLNERPMPLVSLGKLLDVPTLDRREDDIKVLALKTTERAVAFEVDELFNEVELVLKPLGDELLHAPFVAGAAILGSGEVIIVLDTNDLVRRATGYDRHGVSSSPASINPAPINRPPRILVVDDSITTRTLEKNILEAVGFEVHVAIDGTEAWARVADIAPDIIVSDVEMPRMNGLELTRLLKRTSDTRHIPVILLTSLAKPQQREDGLAAGADAYLIKSRFDQDELLATIKSMVADLY
ncbi:MAG: response regulator [Anaerolineae bacterium]